MSKTFKLGSIEISRRTLLQGVAVAGSVPLLALRGGPAAAKTAQSAVAYETSPKGGHSCGTCSSFEPPSSCKLVDGSISPNGWCKLWSQKAS
jgi:hypothetical protein